MVETPLDLRYVRHPVAYGLHEDRTPSLHLYEDGTWYCFGCRQGGSIYDFAAALWHIGTRRREFLQLRARLTEQFAITTPA